MLWDFSELIVDTTDVGNLKFFFYLFYKVKDYLIILHQLLPNVFMVKINLKKKRFFWIPLLKENAQITHKNLKLSSIHFLLFIHNIIGTPLHFGLHFTL